MKSIASSFACRQPRLAKPLGEHSSDADLAAWARDVVRHPQRHAATERESAIVAGLLVDLEAGL